MHRTSDLLLQPTRRQVEALEDLREFTQQLYNAALEERIGAWKWEGRAVSRFEQYGQVSGWNDPRVKRFGVQPIRGTLNRLDRAFQAFFRRVKNGDSPGFPRFKSFTRWDSIEYGEVMSWRIKNGKLYVQGVGHIRFRGSKRALQRLSDGAQKTLVLKRQGDRWRAFVAVELEAPEPRSRTRRECGIDMGVIHLATTSDGIHIENPRHLAASLDRLAREQQVLAKKQRGSNRRKRQVQRVAAAHRKIRNQRRGHHHKVSRQLINAYDLIAVEALQIDNISRRPKPRTNADGTFAPNGASAKARLNRAITDAGWGELLRFITYKAEEAGAEVIAVNPRHTSQTCHECGHVDRGNRVTQAVFRCLACGHGAHADVNAARNILRAGRALRFEREGCQQSPALMAGGCVASASLMAR